MGISYQIEMNVAQAMNAKLSHKGRRHIIYLAVLI